ncbi:hypothetical protein J7E62_29855 [Variovorax paradoxus]|nr:hypothetical protein [Variovorax paradoxus]
MADEHEDLTAQQRLAISRRALLRQMRQGDQAVIDEPAPAISQHRSARHESAFARIDWASVGRHAARRWWRRHPANAAGQLARPVLDRYAREQPAKLMAAAAAAGALVVLVKPWRLLSVTAVIAAVLKTSDVADLVTTLMRKKPSPSRKDSP